MTTDGNLRETHAPPSVPHRAEFADDLELSRIAERNLRVAMSLRASAWELMAAGLRAFRPDMPEDAVQDEVRTHFRRAAG